MPIDPTCVFCRIVAGQIPSYKVFEDDVVLAFLDIGPVVKGHTLVVSKQHYPSVMETPGEVLAAINHRIPQISRMALAASGATACNVLINNGAEAGQSVKHIHYHILPRRRGDAFDIPWKAGTLAPADAATLQSAAIAALASQM
jgi:histidine triad (HIT) family protein